MIGVAVYICIGIHVFGQKKLNRTFNDQLAFSSIRGRTSCQIYGLVLPLSARKTLSSLSKSRISLFKVHLTLLSKG